jgi:hypothetical protein
MAATGEPYSVAARALDAAEAAAGEPTAAGGGAGEPASDEAAARPHPSARRQLPLNPSPILAAR